MKKYKHLLKKIQYASVDIEVLPHETIGDIMTKIEEMSEEELGFGLPEYHLQAITKEEGKISKIVWRKK